MKALKELKLQFFEKAIDYMKQELTNDQKNLKEAKEQKNLNVKRDHFEWT